MRDEEPTDEALMAGYAAGDAASFRGLYARLAPRVHAFYLRAFRSRAVADDLLQTAFLKLHAARASYRAGSPVRPWLFSIVARVRLDELRRMYRVPPTVGDEELAERVVADDPRGGDVFIDEDERARAVRAAVDALPEGQRIVVHLNRFEGLTLAEVAAALGLKEGAVRVRAFRAYEALRQALVDLGPEGEGR